MLNPYVPICKMYLVSYLLQLPSLAKTLEWTNQIQFRFENALFPNHTSEVNIQVLKIYKALNTATQTNSLGCTKASR